MPNADFLVHHGTAEQFGDSMSVIAEGDQLKRTMERMLEVYAERVVDCEHPQYKGKSQKVIQTKLKKEIDCRREWYMTSQEAIEMNLIDGVLGDEGFESVTKLREENLNS